MRFRTAVAFLATAPFTALHFGVLQPAGIVANLQTKSGSQWNTESSTRSTTSSRPAT